MRIYVCGLLLVAPLFAQNVGVPVNQVKAPPIDPWVTLSFYDGSGNLINQCSAQQNQPNNGTGSNAGVFSIANALLTNLTISGGVATLNFPSTSFLWVGAQVTMSGSATTAVNATYRVSAVSGTTATIVPVPPATIAANATYTDTLLSAATFQPLINQAVWAIHVLTYTGTTLNNDYWAYATNTSVNTQSGQAVTQGAKLLCSNRANY